MATRTALSCLETAAEASQQMRARVAAMCQLVVTVGLCVSWHGGD